MFDILGSGNVQQQVQQPKSGGLLDDIGDLFKSTPISVNVNTKNNQEGTLANMFDMTDIINN